jgi:hypothetical protein
MLSHASVLTQKFVKLFVTFFAVIPALRLAQDKLQPVSRVFEIPGLELYRDFLGHHTSRLFIIDSCEAPLL